MRFRIRWISISMHWLYIANWCIPKLSPLFPWSTTKTRTKCIKWNWVLEVATWTSWLRKSGSNFLKCNFPVVYVHHMMVELVCATTRKCDLPRRNIIVNNHRTNINLRNASASQICFFVTTFIELDAQCQILGATLEQRRSMSDIVDLCRTSSNHDKQWWTLQKCCCGR